MNATRTPAAEPLRPLRWIGGTDGCLELIDQTLLPGELRWIACRDLPTLFDAIRRLAVRGAPAIGVSAAYGVVLGLGRGWEKPTRDWPPRVAEVCDYLAGSRPTAVNLFWALDRMRRRADALRGHSLDEAREALLAEAHVIRDEDAAMCRAIGRFGMELIPDGGGVLTHCNAGALATSEYGTALALMYAAHEAGRRFRAYVDETRPLLQGARLTAWELMQAGIETTLICDSVAAQVMREGRVQLVVTGADRIAANGDVANKIGTYGVAVLARAHGVPFCVAAPSSTFDLSIPDGSRIPIEQRDPDEIRAGFGRRTAPADVACYSPAFDVTPAEYITALITERGVIRPVTAENIRRMLV
ncbi:MAG: S-methyl-5-thioribose-1-phosphate isomerase [Phycisphaerae bacterium]|nr:S-methyl-5-thioribose-1-phosphate isomerase [Phycisphaerae bacterium]NUQ46323.1 S-methyl-5-thioribose-1-phosphate isomerase [Phycisphaerae bacterium]